MSDYSILIAAAGNGTRSGLSYPKTLYPVRGKPILIHLLTLFSSFSSSSSVVVSPKGKNQVYECLQTSNFHPHLITQPSPKGMGDAVLQFTYSPDFHRTKNLILVWGDIPFIQAATVSEMIRIHEINKNDFTFPTRIVDSAYTYVLRDQKNRLVEVVETRELGIEKPSFGERDIGLFVFKKDLVINMLQKELQSKYGKASGEHGFLYIIKELILQGAKVEAPPIATDKDLISLNYIEDLKDCD
jgi:bifunctional N-acetylglucosamine-1-phosphate-uridyltransferase/glucosamine-1-phosphate-acetyltransferase GlmU-like protein